MRVKDILATLGVAAVTTAFTVVVFGPGQVGATNEAEGIKPTIAQPKLKVDGCEFALTTEKTSYQADEMPVLKIEAVNPTDAPIEKTMWVGMSASSPASLVSRVMVVPQPLWTEKCLVNLKPGEKKTISLATKTKLPAGQSVSIMISDKDLTVLARALSIQGKALQLQTTAQAVNALRTTNQAVNTTQAAP